MMRAAEGVLALALCTLVSSSASGVDAAAPGSGRPPVRWGATIKETYHSQALGRKVGFRVSTPPADARRKTWPLVVVLKAGVRVRPSATHPFFEVKPGGCGIWGYRSMSGDDVAQVIAHMKRHYPIDPDRVLLIGLSAGASGAMHFASGHADELACVVPLIAIGTDLDLPNFRNLPVAIHHGDRDWVSSICNVRVQYRKMQDLGVPVTSKEYPGAGHGIPAPHDAITEWMLSQKRNPAPRTITHECESPNRGRAYWLHIREFVDPHRRASVKASLDVVRRAASIRTVNVAAFTVDMDILSGAGHEVATLSVNGTEFPCSRTSGLIAYRFDGEAWGTVPVERVLKTNGRPYQAGAAADLYQGEPLLIVCGTNAEQPERARLLKQAAAKLARCGGPAFSLMREGFPVVTDVALTAEQAASCNLLLVGTPGDNHVTASLLPELPVTIRNGHLEAGNRPPLALAGRVLSLLARSPAHPGRLVYVVAPFMDDAGLAEFAKAPQYFLAGAEGFDRISQPDLCVQSQDRHIVRAMQYDKDWAWPDRPGTTRPIPERFQDRAQLATVIAALMRRRSKADLALWWGPADQGSWGYDFNYLREYEPGTCTLADFRTQHRRVETMLGGIPGSDLKQVLKRWVQKDEILTVPKLDPNGIEDQRTYRIHIPIDMYIKLGQRRKNLLDPEPGPTVTFDEVAAGIFPDDD